MFAWLKSDYDEPELRATEAALEVGAFVASWSAGEEGAEPALASESRSGWETEK